MKNLLAVVDKVEYVGNEMVVIYFHAKGLRYEPGQYITVYFQNSSTPAGKAYSLSSAPHEKLAHITVKRIGEFSGKLYSLKPGDSFDISQAYGHFNPHTDKPLVGVSAGVGIAPVWSVIKDELKRDEAKLVQLFCSNKDHAAIPHDSNLSKLGKRHDNFDVHHHITRRDDVPAHMYLGRIDVDDVVRAVEDEANYLVCGSVEFVHDMWQGLTVRGVPASSISTETFFE